MTNNWNEYKKLVLSEQEKINKRLEKIEETQNEILTKIAVLRVKSGIWGLMGGIIPISIMVILYLLMGKK